MKKNKLLIPIFMGMSYRNFITSKILNNLLIEYEIYFLTYKNSRISELLQSLGFNIIEFELNFFNKITRKLTLFIEKLQYYSFYQKHHTDTTRKYIQRDMESFLNRILFKISNLIGKVYDECSFFSWHYQYFLNRSTKKKIRTFDKVFLLSTDDVMDKAILKFCKNEGININIIVHSWDNLPARGFLADKPNRLLVWNSIMKAQAQVLHGINEKIIDVVGIPQFHFYKQVEKKISYDDFIRYYGVENNSKVITYTCSAFRVFPDEELFIKKLVAYTKKNNFIFILRFHPTERINEYTNLFSNIKHVILDVPSGSFAATITKNINADEIEILKFISLMKYSNVVLNLASTITLDAIIFDTPVICISFNADETIKDHWNNAEQWYKSSHYTDIINSNSVKIAKNFAELEKYISLYISDDKMDSQNRKGLANRFCNINYDVPSLLLESMQK